MGLGPHPVARARRGLRNCKAAPLGFPPQGAGGRPVARGRKRLEEATPGHYMSGVGAPATRPRPVARARRGARNRATASPRLEATTSHPPYVWGWGPSYTTPKL
eukprot:gene20576-biopygen17589